MAKVCTVICQESDLMFNDIIIDKSNIIYATILQAGNYSSGMVLNETYSFTGNEKIIMIAVGIDDVNIPLVCMQLTSNGAYYFDFEMGEIKYSTNRNFQYDVNILESADYIVTSNPPNQFESISNDISIPIEYAYAQDRITFANLVTSNNFSISGQSTPNNVNMIAKTKDDVISDNHSISDGGGGEIVIFNRDNKAFAIGYFFTTTKSTIACGILFLTSGAANRMFNNKTIPQNSFENDYQIRAVDRWYAYYTVKLNYPDSIDISVYNT